MVRDNADCRFSISDWPVTEKLIDNRHLEIGNVENPPATRGGTDLFRFRSLAGAELTVNEKLGFDRPSVRRILCPSHSLSAAAISVFGAKAGEP